MRKEECENEMAQEKPAERKQIVFLTCHRCKNHFFGKNKRRIKVVKDARGGSWVLGRLR